MTRRQWIALFGAAAAQRAMAQTPLKFRGLDHIEFTVADVERSTAFYAQLFGGMDVMKNRTTTRRYLKLGTSYMAIDRADAPRIDHVCVGVENFDIATVHEYLTSQGLMYRDYPSGRDTGVNDPDGTRLQLSSVDGWTSLAAQTALPEPKTLAQSAVFQPAQLASIQVSVADMAASSAHYEKLLGRPTGRGAFMIGRDHFDLVAASESSKPGFHSFTIRAEKFDVATVTRRLNTLGARMENAERPGAVQFLDPDGFRVEVTTV